MAGVLVAMLMWTIGDRAHGQSVRFARGRDLYEQSCTSCHGKSVHDRNPRSARGISEIRGFVERWSTQLGTRWSATQVDDVVLYLNQRFYHYPCPDENCVRQRLSAYRREAR